MSNLVIHIINREAFIENTKLNLVTKATCATDDETEALLNRVQAGEAKYTDDVTTPRRTPNEQTETTARTN